MDSVNIKDIIGIGLGPYNLGLAALLEKAPELEAAFFDESQEFAWHPGMLIEEMDLQVPFLADLVTFADPTSRFSYLNFLHERNRMYQFYFFKKFEVPRNEYNDYLRWAIQKLDNLHFQSRVVDILDHQDANDPHYELVVEAVNNGKRTRHYARHVVMGTGSTPSVPQQLEGMPASDVVHTSRYLEEKENLLEAECITIVGSGQSAAEVFLDLLREQDRIGCHLALFTRSPGLFQLEQAKLGQEFFSPDYVDYFHSLGFEERNNTLEMLDKLRKGIDPDTLREIYNILYQKSHGGRKIPVTIQPLTEIKDIKKNRGGYQLTCHQWQQDKTFPFHTDKVVLATGYKPAIPDWFQDRFAAKIEWEDDKRFKVTRDYQLAFKQTRPNQFFTLTNLEHSHGAGATNLGLAVQRNVHIINNIAGREVYPNQRDTIFQQFTME
ncbi:lysine N(6)-hydroxylase/L-ornithine N(5)-oxygenase family protein [Sediminibacillus halophilus]|uniref:L-lysine N6-monooxygenase MbtG n=1 Tax=Sediminibacillus halophilus TaxID=482461 RepID=A0A1G9TKA1_9BACI|nr:SidA/IucD/PvdA family monooxygenase [Sediminibacillus halophilus]SDM47585.1 lysine N6-hydroxylase [Sediminibacillus halophilus]